MKDLFLIMLVNLFFLSISTVKILYFDNKNCEFNVNLYFIFSSSNKVVLVTQCMNVGQIVFCTWIWKFKDWLLEMHSVQI